MLVCSGSFGAFSGGPGPLCTQSQPPMDLNSFLKDKLWLFMLIAIVLALAVPQAGVHATPYSIYFLLALMFFTSLGIELHELRRAMSQKGILLAAFAMMFFVAPAIAFMFSGGLEPEMALGLVLYAAMPAAMANAFYIKRMGSNGAFALAITVLTTLASPFLTPLAVKAFTGMFIQIDMMGLFLSLLKMVIIPFAAAELLRRYSPGTAKRLLGWSGAASTICIFFVVFGVISSASGELWSLGYLALLTILLGLASFAVCYALPKERFVIGYGNAVRNGTLAMVVALEVFGPVAALPSVMMTLVHNAMMVPLVFFTDRRMKARTVRERQPPSI